ncbi:hypothetical protein T05_13247 [Trichinella murrelli]|uniref:Uncharacterized protein n=1 Tax=Trichinella murrelli TaxID=144512 RepID=A0A0V0TQZ8_9BILA|nr:hypothetical protein T05_13247 [Trichinella murrelli]
MNIELLIIDDTKWTNAVARLRLNHLLVTECDSFGVSCSVYQSGRCFNLFNILSLRWCFLRKQLYQSLLAKQQLGDL